MAESFAQFEQRVRNLHRELEGDRLKATVTKVGVAAKAAATKAASADLGGDPKFSGWAPTLDTRFDHVRPGVISFHPTARSAGPWTVAEFGRNQSAGPRMVGPRLTKTGRVSTARGKKWNGRTAGKHTATEAVSAIGRETPLIVDREITRAIRKFFS